MSKAESADLILKLYELRRESVMRDARNWMMTFLPESAEEIMNAMFDEQSSAYIRMVTSYWEMAAALVNQGAIDEEMFNETNGEHIFIFSKIYPFLSEIREMNNNPNAFSNLEKLVMRMPDAEANLERRREMMKKWRETKAETAHNN